MDDTNEHVENVLPENFTHYPVLSFFDGKIHLSIHCEFYEHQFKFHNHIDLEWVIDEAIKEGYGEQIIERIKSQE